LFSKSPKPAAAKILLKESSATQIYTSSSAFSVWVRRQPVRRLDCVSAALQTPSFADSLPPSECPRRSPWSCGLKVGNRQVRQIQTDNFTLYQQLLGVFGSVDSNCVGFSTQAMAAPNSGRSFGGVPSSFNALLNGHTGLGRQYQTRLPSPVRSRASGHPKRILKRKHPESYVVIGILIGTFQKC